MADPSDQPRLYGPLASVLLTVFLFLGSQITAGLLLGLLPLLQGWDTAKTANWLNHNTWAMGSYMILAAAVTLSGLHFLLKRRGLHFRALGLNTFQVKYLGYAAGGFIGYFLLNILVRMFVAAFTTINIDQEQDVGFQPGAHNSLLILVFACLVILPALAEEIVMRGFLFGGLRARLPFLQAAFITSVIFGAAHLAGAKEGLLWIGAIDTFVLSLVLCYLREKTGSLWPGIGVHMIKNALAFTVLFIVMN